MAKVNDKRLAFVGPTDPEFGFPLWYEDGAGVRLDLGLRPDPMTPAVGDLPSPGAPVKLPENYPDEAFYYLAESRMPAGGAGTVGRARLVLALEAAFGGAGLPDPNSRVVFSRIRVRIDDVVPGATYIVTHPYGVTGELIADDRGRAFHTEDQGIADQDFEAVLRAGLVAPFLRWATGAPAGYLGDGVSEREVVGSPFNTNFFRIDGPRVADGGGPRDPADPANVDRIQNALFTVQGRVATRLGVTPVAARYARGSDGRVVIDLHASSVPGQSVELRGAGVPRTAAVGFDCTYVARADVTAVPVLVEAVNASDVPLTRIAIPVTDLVTVEEAEFDHVARTLTVTAHSSDASGPALEATGFGPLTGATPAAPTVFTGVTAAPASVTVTSAAGGRTDRAVTVVGPSMPALPDVPDPAPVPDPPQPPPVKPQVLVSEFRTGRQQFRVSGNYAGALPASVIVTFRATELGRGAVDITGAWSVRRTLNGADSALRPAVGDTLTARVGAGEPDAPTIRIRN